MTRLAHLSTTSPKRRLRGFTLIEMMISIVVASLLSIAVINTFTSQSAMYTNQSQRNRMANDGRDAYEVISRLLRQSESSSIVATTSGTTFTLDFEVPEGFPVWPNTTAPYSNNAIRLQWNSAGNSANQIQITNASSIAGLGGATLVTLVGSNSGSNTQISNFAVSQGVNNDYTLNLTARAGSSGPSTQFQGVVMPRN